MAYFRTQVVEVHRPVGQLGIDAPTQRRVNIQPSAPSVAYEQFGVEAREPYVLYDETEAAGEYVPGGRVVDTDTGESYAIVATPATWRTLTLGAHVRVLLERVSS